MSNQQVVLVTGASSGIGKAIAELLADKGYYVYASAGRDAAMFIATKGLLSDGPFDRMAEMQLD